MHPQVKRLCLDARRPLVVPADGPLDPYHQTDA
jgi:hypothetical protein